MFSKLKVLIIEDDPNILEVVGLCFAIKWTDTDIECHYAYQGEEGLKLVKTYSPDIIILDLGLPDIDGLDVLQQIRSFSKVPVIILTVRDREIDKVAGLDLGADDYIVKPFSPNEFLSRVKAVLRRSQMPELQVSERRFDTKKVLVNQDAIKASVAGQSLNFIPHVYDGNNGNNQLQKAPENNGYYKTEVEENEAEEAIDDYWKEYTIEFTWEQFVRELKSLYHFCHSCLNKSKLLIPGSNRNIYTRFIKTALNGVGRKQPSNG